MELRLRHAGIAVLTQEESLKAPGAPVLDVAVIVFFPSSPLVRGLAAYSILVELHQTARLETDASLALVSTWRVVSIGTSGVDKLHAVRDSVTDDVDKFINAYLSVHPRTTGSVAPPVSLATSPRQTLIRQVQERLQAEGFNPGTIDGAMGPQTRDALRWFQNTKGLLATGELDEKTLDALGVR